MRDDTKGDTDYPLQVVPPTASMEKKEFLRTLCAQVGAMSSTRNEFAVLEYDVEMETRPQITELMSKSIK